MFRVTLQLLLHNYFLESFSQSDMLSCTAPTNVKLSIDSVNHKMTDLSRKTAGDHKTHTHNTLKQWSTHAAMHGEGIVRNV